MRDHPNQSFYLEGHSSSAETVIVDGDDDNYDDDDNYEDDLDDALIGWAGHLRQVSSDELAMTVILVMTMISMMTMMVLLGGLGTSVK